MEQIFNFDYFHNEVSTKVRTGTNSAECGFNCVPLDIIFADILRMNRKCRLSALFVR